MSTSPVTRTVRTYAAGGPASLLSQVVLDVDEFVYDRTIRTHRLGDGITRGGRIVAIEGRDIVSVKDAAFGAAGDGSTDDTSAIQQALYTGRSIFLPAGVYQVSSPLFMTQPNQHIYGSGYTSIIKTTSATADIINPLVALCAVSDLAFDSYVTRTAGNVFNVAGTASRFTAENIYSHKAFRFGLINSGTASWTFRHIICLENTPAVGIGVTDLGGIDGTIDDMLIDAGSLIAIGLDLQNCGDITLLDSQLLTCDRPLYAHPGAGQNVLSLYASNTFFDHGGTGVDLFANGGSIQRMNFVECEFGSMIGHGCNIRTTGSSGTSDGIDFLGCEFYLNGGSGLNLADNLDINVNIAHSKLAANTVAGISTGANCSQFHIKDNTIGPCAGFAGNGTGIVLGTGVDGYTISGNKLGGNTSGAISGTPGSTGATVRLKDNDGFATQAKGTGSVGSATTSVTITHGLAMTPLASDIVLTANSATPVFLDPASITSTQFTVHTASAPGGSGAPFAWQVRSLGS